MDPGTVVWLPGSGFTQEDYDAACGGGYYACGTEPYGDGVLVFRCNACGHQWWLFDRSPQEDSER